jgi:signal transduction histidine kinase
MLGSTKWLLLTYAVIADHLDEQGKDYLIRVRKASQRMAQLIDDLLKLSRVTRSGMNREIVDLSAIVRAIAGNIRKQHPERAVKFIIADDLKGSGDAPLLTIAIENLLANAWKFTKKNPRTVIEFGVVLRDAEKVYHIKDNGAGFDMAFASKLFNPFQRLHQNSEFPGTGIGLATVKRIINRHGGRVWIEREENKGATVCFTL